MNAATLKNSTVSYNFIWFEELSARDENWHFETEKKTAVKFSKLNFNKFTDDSFDKIFSYCLYNVVVNRRWKQEFLSRKADFALNFVPSVDKQQLNLPRQKL